MQTLSLVDSHCHLNRLDLDVFSDSLEQALATARAEGVKHFLTVSVEREDALVLKDLAYSYPRISYSVGWHPTSVRAQPLYDWLIDLGRDERCIALGETGLDFYHQEEGQTVNMQIQAFREHIQAAKVLAKPLIIHTRQSAIQTLNVLREEKANEVGGVMHCFTENWEIAKQALDLGFMISLSGIVSFKNANIVHEVAKKTPLGSLLIETDSPYLAPTPYRGKSNHPAWVKYVAQAIADLRCMRIEEVGQATTLNFYRYFKVNPDD